MFTKPYRKPLAKIEEDSANLWLQKDINAADPELIASLQIHVDKLSLSEPRRQNSSLISFKYDGSHDYILRDVNYEHVIVKSLLNPLFENGFKLTLNKIIARLTTIERFVHNNKSTTINKLSYGGLGKSMDIILRPHSKNVKDIEYIDIFYDNTPNVLVLDKPIGNSIQKEMKRTAVSLRLCMKPTEAKFSINKEFNHCVHSIEDGRAVNLDDKRFSQFNLESTEYNFELYYDDIENLVLKFLQGSKDSLSKKLDYTVTEVDQSMIDLIDMSIY